VACTIREVGVGRGLTSFAGSVAKFVAQKPDFVKIRSKFTANRKSFPRIDQIDEFQGARADHWRGGLTGGQREDFRRDSEWGCTVGGRGVAHAGIVDADTAGAR
jgi:hypothetical protein